MATFLFVARNQLFWDGNKRTGRLLMNGLLLSGGHDVITVPAKKRLEFNTKMVRFYDTADSSEMVEFLAACSIDRALTIKNMPSRQTELPTGTGTAGKKHREPPGAPERPSAAEAARRQTRTERDDTRGR